jgi:hypothetical protein
VVLDGFCEITELGVWLKIRENFRFHPIFAKNIVHIFMHFHENCLGKGKKRTKMCVIFSQIFEEIIVFTEVFVRD